ncbi:MAG: hypothetical protein HYZ50_07445 [Deltaproteobacteria bacterium]|nr:hypothetical protein [Deltaproteobacteria bacterium]
MIHRQTLSALLAGAVFFTMAGCKISPPAPPITPMTQAQFNAVSDCQAAIKKESLDFTEIKTKKLQRCVDKVVELQLKLENGLMTQDQYDVALEKQRAKCARDYELITKASTNLVDGINYWCKPIESLILGPDDPLQFQTFNSEVFSGPVGAIEDIGGFICGIKEVLVDIALGAEVPRLCYALATLGPEFVLDEGSVCLPNIPLDSRCDFFSAPPP